MGQTCNRPTRGGVVDVCIHTKEPSKPGPSALSVNDIHFLQGLGSGSYSTVRLAKLPGGVPVAVKVMNKVHILKTKQVAHVFSERQILKVLNSPFVVEFLATLQDDQNLYCVMEFVQGGELFRYMCQKERLSVSEAHFYTAEVSLAMCHLHAIRCVYRDLKPENVLLTAEGHIKLVDFGFAKLIPRGERTYTVCGTPEYLAPEVIEQTGYDTSADWWQVGILLYEMLVGSTPFSDPSPYILYESILTAPLEFPCTGFNPEARDLISRLLRKDPKKRPRDDEVLKHPFFKDVDWSDVRMLHLQPPVIPVLHSTEDTSCFETFDVKEKTESAVEQTIQSAFLGY